MIIQIPAKFKSHLYVQIRYGGKIKLCRSDLDVKYIYVTAFYNRNNLDYFKNIIESYSYTIDLDVNKKILREGFKGVGDYAVIDINKYLCRKFDEFFLQYMNNFGFDHSKRYPRYDLGIESFYEKYNIDEALLSREYMSKFYYRHRCEVAKSQELEFCK
jgi:hypothetical protein